MPDCTPRIVVGTTLCIIGLMCIFGSTQLSGRNFNQLMDTEPWFRFIVVVMIAVFILDIAYIVVDVWMGCLQFVGVIPARRPTDIELALMMSPVVNKM